MDLPPSGWYPDPYGTPDLLRWWDGLNWTHHTHPGVDAADTGGGGNGAGAAGNGASGGGAAVQATTVQSSVGLSGAGLSGAGLSGAGLSGAAGSGGWAARERVIGDWAGTDWPTGEQLATT